MINFYKTENNQIVSIANFADGCWISAINPTENEISYLVNDLKLDADFVRSSLDEEESSRIENEDDQTLVIVDMPTMTNEDNNTVHYTTMPIGIIITEANVITICTKPNPVIDDIAKGMVKNVHTQLKTRFLLMLLFRGATRYLMYLKQIDRISSHLESKLHKSMKNQELIELLGLEKSLVYFSTSLKSNEVTLEKILRGRVLKLYEDDRDLLEDALIEIRQAIEMDVEHISAYSLMYEEGTPLHRMLKQGLLTENDDELSAGMYSILRERLSAAHYEHYEISNFARMGHRSKHNSNYWNGTPYIGLGAAAHSFDRQSRQWNVSNVEEYIQHIEGGTIPMERETIDARTRYNDMITTALRTCEGIDLSALPPAEHDYIIRYARRSLDAGLLTVEGTRMRLTEKGLFVSDDIMSDLIWVD